MEVLVLGLQLLVQKASLLLPPISEDAGESKTRFSPSDKVDPICPPLPVLGGGWGFLLPPFSRDANETRSGLSQSEEVSVSESSSC